MDKKTGFSHPECYASDLADCSREMSREHYVSESVLRAIDGGGKSIEVRGLPWQPNGASQRISTAALTEQVLCKRHNQALTRDDGWASCRPRQMRMLARRRGIS